MPDVILRHLYRSPGHDFFGRHGQAPENHGIEECDEFELVAGSGIRGDRFFGYKPDYKGQITFFNQAWVESARDYLGDPTLPATAFRRNVIVEGIDLNTLIGLRFRLGGVLFKGAEECKPCYWMDQACGKPGVEDLLKGNGGLRCRILEDGILRKGPVRLELPEAPVLDSFLPFMEA